MNRSTVISLDEQVLALEISQLTGESPEEATRVSLEERLIRERSKTASRPRPKPIDDAAIDAIVKRFNALPILDTRTDDEILGYDENGLPT